MILFTVLGASVGRPGTRSHVKVGVKRFMRTSGKELLFVRLIVKPMTHQARGRQSSRYADGHVVVFGTIIHRQEHQGEEPLMVNVGVTLNSLLPEPLNVSKASEIIYLPDSGLGGEALRKQLQGPIRTSFINNISSGGMFNLTNVKNLNKKGENLPLCCIRSTTIFNSGSTRCSSKRNRNTRAEAPEKKPEKTSKKSRTNLDEAKKKNSAQNSNTVTDGAVRGNLESVQKARDLQLQKTEYEMKIAKLKLELAEAHHAQLVANEAEKSTYKTEFYERMITFMHESRTRESTCWEKNVKTVERMSDKTTANMLKVQMASHGSNAETNVLIGTALQNSFFSTTSSTDGRMIEEQGEPQLLIKSTEQATS